MGIYVVSSDGKHDQAGDYKRKFTIQSIVKPVLLLRALMGSMAGIKLLEKLSKRMYLSIFNKEGPLAD